MLTIALLLSGLVVLTSWAPAEGGTPVEPQNPLAEVSQTSEDGTIESTPAVPRPHGGWTREGVRAWVEKMGVPSAQLLASSSERAFFEMGEGVGGGVITPHDVNEVAVHESDLAHMLGFNGTGVTVAIVDTGVDFAHPDLYNRTARVLDPGSPYYLHPMAHDASSLNDYLRFGEPGPQSWFVNTSFSTTVVEVANGTRWVDWTGANTTLSWNVTGVAGLTAGEEVRIGFHPDEKLELLLGRSAGLILFHEAGAGGPFDSVMVDLDGDFDMGDEKRAYFNTAFGPAFDPEAELMFQDLDGDGIQDVSGGMVYFIADGVREIPYAARQIDTLNFTWQTFTNNNSFDIWEGLDPAANLVPGNGDLTLIFGDLNEPGTDGSHGTWIASAIAGQGRTGGFGASPVLAGQAPGAKILAAGNNFVGADPLGFGIYTELVFAAEGYDGVTGSGDEAQIVSNSWGGPGWAGWDWSSRFADYVSNVLADEATLYVFGAGNNGPGWGGRADPPGGASLLIAGGMENYFYRLDPWFAFDGGPNPSFGGTAEFSSRGPSALGRHYIDALASGASGYGADPLNDNPFVADSGLTLDGNSSWILWSGTSLSAPNLAGVAALVYDAYASAHLGQFPMASTAKTIIKNAADDAGQDPLLTGAGLANALRGVLIASEADGLTTSIDEWNPGDYRGTVYDAYPNLLPAGGGDMTTVTLTNHRPAMPLDVTIADAVLASTGNVSFTFTRAPFSGADEYLFNASGFLAMDGTVLVPGSPTLWATADAIRVSVYISRLDMIDYTPQFRFRIYDWTDVNGNGASEGISEGNLMTQDMPTWLDLHGPNGVVFVHDPATRSHDGLYLRNDVFREARDPVEVYVVVDYFERMDWPWLSASVPMVTIPAASLTTVDLMVSVPAAAKPGLYEAMYLFTLDNGDVTTLPVVVNVATGAIPFTFGDPSVGDSGHYQQGQTYGLWWGDTDIKEVASGDWRYYFLDVVEAVNATVLVGWDEPLSHSTLHVLTNEPDWFSDTAMARYGPNTLDTVVFTDIEIPTGNGTSVVAPLNPGLSIIAVQSVFVAGVGAAETLRGEVAVIGVSPPSLTGVGVPVEDESTFTITSPDLGFSGLQSSIESGSVLIFLDQPVDPFPIAGQPLFEIYLFEAPNRLRMDIEPTVTRVTYELFFHSGARDVDFGVFSDPDCDMVYSVADIEDFVGTLDNPEILTINNPIAGCHWVHVAGFSVDPGSLYDLTVTFVAEPVVSVTSLPADIVPAIPADVTIAWALPHTSQPVAGTVFIGSAQFPLAIPLPFALVADLPPMFSGRIPLPGSLIANNAPSIGLAYEDTPDAFETAVDPDSVVLRLDGVDLSTVAVATANGVFLGLAALPFTLQDGFHAAFVEVRDLNGSVNRTTWSFTVDTVAPNLNIVEPTVPITNNPMVTVSGMTEPGATVTVDGTAVTVDASGAFSTVLTLSEGDHALPVVARDVAGNAAIRTVDVTVDTVAPAISISGPSDGETVTVASVTVVGQTEPGAAVSVNGISVEPAADGSFSVSLGLSEGENMITAIATDLAGNSASTSLTVTVTDQVPGLPDDLASLQGQVTLLLALAIAGFALAGVLFFLYWRLRRQT